MEEIGKIGYPEGLRQSGESQKANKGVEDFKDVLENFLKEVNTMQNDTDGAIKKFVAGESIDIHDVMIAAQEAHISFQLMLEMRNKLLAAYQEVMRTNV